MGQKNGSKKLIDADALWMDVIRSMDYCDDILEIIERQPTINTEVVSRNAVIAVIEDWIEAAKECCHDESASDLSCVKNDVIALPSVTVGG